MSLDTVISLLISAVGGGVLATILNYRLQTRKDDVANSFVLISHLREEIDRQKEKLEILELENRELSVRVKTLEAASEDLPFPMWHKDLSGNYLWVNAKYVEVFLTPYGKTIFDVIGKKDSDFWPQDVSNTLRDLSLKALSSSTKEAFALGLKLGDSVVEYAVFKYPMYAFRTHVGWAGLALKQG